MKKSIRRLVMLGAVVLGLGFGVTAFADTSDTGTSSANATTSTNMGITFTGTYHPSTGGGGANINSDSSSSGNSGESSGVLTDGGDGDAVNEDIPSGHNPTTSVTSGHSAANKPAGAVASVVHSGTADLVAGRLPQTGESQVFLASVFGLFLLIAITLLAVVRWQARLLRENK
ncbi:LPXTG cell wall anchor domain-containing protein [Levilactobacillus parabrevis]|uniref:LPXTG cell wall anchor domain-containing protein n=1 Tax=Levilactobacillus parabrevis TaxID=357278 RepID=UPI00037A48AF|nr:LPXTG cell wall anchor domain-containing protein [Levilactobacillus parabrevis]